VDWNDVRLIAEIGRTGSFTGAAAVLGISKPTVSRRVAYLEQIAQSKIFRRGPHGVALTSAGEQLVRRATPIGDAIVDFELLLRSMGSAERPIISVQMTEGVASYLMTPALSGQQVGPLGQAAKRTGLKLPEMKLLPPDTAERIDISLVWTHYGDLPKGGQTNKVRKLANIRFRPFYSGHYGKDRSPPESFAALAGHRLITMGAYRWFSKEGWADWHGLLAGAQDPIAVDWSSAIGVLVRGGAGVGLLPTYSPLYSESVLPVEVASPPMFGSLWMVCTEDAYKDAPVRDCFTILGKLFGAADWMNGPA